MTKIEEGRIRTVFEDFMLRHAIDFYQKTKGAENENDETEYCVGVIIFSWTFLESYINCFINGHLQWFKLDIIQDDFRGVSTVQKYSFLLRIISDEHYKRGSEPMESFLLLNKIRNKLIHFEGKGESVSKDAPPKKLIQNCKQKFKIKDIRTSTLRRILTKECAEWTLKTAMNIVHSFEMSVYKKDIYFATHDEFSELLKTFDEKQ